MDVIHQRKIDVEAFPDIRCTMSCHIKLSPLAQEDKTQYDEIQKDFVYHVMMSYLSVQIGL